MRTGFPASPRGSRCANTAPLVTRHVWRERFEDIRAFERYLQAHPGSFFAVQLEYDDDSQYPTRFVYSLVRKGQFETQAFANT